MSIISGPEIERLATTSPFLSITPFVRNHVGPNSIDVTLAPELLVYAPQPRFDRATGCTTYTMELDCRSATPTRTLTIPDDGFILNPNVLYIGSTVERTECNGLVPVLNGRSSIGRLGISVHVTAGFGDDGFGGGPSGPCTWTLEITCVHPVRIYAGMRIAQLAFFTLTGERCPYTGRYADQSGPTASRMHLPGTESH